MDVPFSDKACNFGQRAGVVANGVGKEGPFVTPVGGGCLQPLLVGNTMGIWQVHGWIYNSRRREGKMMSHHWF